MKGEFTTGERPEAALSLSEVEMLTRPAFVKPTTESSPFVRFDEIVLEKAKDATSHRKVRSILFYQD